MTTVDRPSGCAGPLRRRSFTSAISCHAGGSLNSTRPIRASGPPEQDREEQHRETTSPLPSSSSHRGRSVGSKSALLCTLVAASSAKSAVFGAPQFRTEVARPCRWGGHYSFAMPLWCRTPPRVPIGKDATHYEFALRLAGRRPSISPGGAVTLDSSAVDQPRHRCDGPGASL